MLFEKANLSIGAEPDQETTKQDTIMPNWTELIEEKTKAATIIEQKISKALLDSLNDAQELNNQIRITPHTSAEGYLDGYRLTGIRRNSIPDQMGIKNGDILMALNDKPFSSPDDFMKHYQQAKNARSFTFLITRRGKPQLLKYSIED